MTSRLHQFQQQDGTFTQIPDKQFHRRMIVAHIGSQHHRYTFAWASQQAIENASSAKIVLSLCADLHRCHLEAISMADEILVVNRCGQVDDRTLHELCLAYNLGKPITWLED